MDAAMHGDELALLRSVLNRGSTYLEFGSGGSTLEAARSPLSRIDSVETDQCWIEKVQAQLCSSIPESASRVHFHHVDIGPTREWGLPATEKINTNWDAYFLDIWGNIPGPPDIVLIDGRFRTASALMCALACTPATHILMHDFYQPLPIRDNYMRVLAFFDRVSSVRSLVSLRRKNEIDQFKLLSVLAQVRTDYW